MIPKEVRNLNRTQAHVFYDSVWDMGWPAIAELCLADRFFLLTWMCGRKDADRDWIYERCREVENDPDNHLDLWAREHYKSTLITFAGILQEIIRNPEITVGIFSFNRPGAKKFLNQIKREMEDNENLYAAFPHIFYKNPQKSSPVWSEDKGIIVKRKGNPKESTVEAYGLIEGLPSGPHFDLRVYDDVITEDEVTNPEQIQKALKMWRQSQNLGKEGGRKWHLGTRYHFNDPYRTMLEEHILKPRIYAGTDTGKPDGKPVLVSEEYLAEKRVELGPYIFSCQWLMNPVADEAQGFDREWIKYHDSNGDGMNKYILVDPASEKKKTSDYTAIFVVGLNDDNNYYVLDIVRDRLNLTERADALFRLHREWKPISVGYEKYGKDSDIQHIEDRMKRENYRFWIVPLGGQTRKEDRIRRLVPVFEQGRMYIPEVLFKTDYEGKKQDLIRAFIEHEYMGFPVAVHDDMLDCLSRIRDPELATSWPRGGETRKPRERYAFKPPKNDGRSWMSL